MHRSHSFFSHLPDHARCLALKPLTPGVLLQDEIAKSKADAWDPSNLGKVVARSIIMCNRVITGCIGVTK